MKIRSLLNEEFRQGSLYRLVEWNQAGKEAVELLSGLHNDPEIYGIFQPADNREGPTAKVAYREVAMIYFHLQYQQKLPHYFTSSGTENKNETIARLVLDGIIEIKWQNNFVTGTAATPAIHDGSIFDASQTPDHLSLLSMQAIHYVWMLDKRDLKSLAINLYTFNSVPWDAFMRSAFIQKHSIKEFLFPESEKLLKQQIDKDWHFVPGSEKRGWLYWTRPPKNSTEFYQTHKLYVSPLVDDMPAVISKSIPVISASEAISFKMGSNMQGLLRPDKMVIYFKYEAPLLHTATLLAKELSKYNPQGVPFSAQLDQKGLLSYGVDPPGSEVPDAIEGGSWRTTVTDQLALAILKTKRDNLNWQQSLEFIKASLLTAGIDPQKWTPIN